jgi:hypothetical protein
VLQDACRVAFRKNCTFAQFSDSTLTFFAQIVPFSGLLMDQLSFTGDLESLLGSAICLHFWHIVFN